MDPPIMQRSTFYIPGRSLSWMISQKAILIIFQKSQNLVRADIRPNSSTLLELLTDELLIKTLRKYDIILK